MRLAKNYRVQRTVAKPSWPRQWNEGVRLRGKPLQSEAEPRRLVERLLLTEIDSEQTVVIANMSRKRSRQFKLGISLLF